MLVSADRQASVARQVLEDLQALVDVEDPQVDRVSCAYGAHQ